MFRPSQALNKLKIHQPLPLNPRESTQLLNILTTSFRQHLDTEHPQFRTEHATLPYPQSFNAPRRRRASSDSAAHSTDRHLNSLLTNPLFNLAPGMKGQKKAEKAITDPMATFDQAVAKGMMNTRSAYACLRQVKQEIVKSSLLNIRDGMKDSGAGLKVLRWLISSGTANDNTFLKDEAFGGILMEFMVAEGLQEAAWTWIKRALETRPKLPARKESRRETITPLMLLLKAEVMGPVSLDAAYLCLSRAAGYFKGSSLLEMRPFLSPPGWFLASEAIFHTRQSASEANFESFLSLVPAISKDTAYHFAHLSVLHPTKPSAELALDFLRKLDMNSAPDSFQESKDTAKTRRSHYQMKLSLDTAKLLLETNQFSEALWVMDFLRTNYPKQLGIKHMAQLEQARAEASSLELLEGLSLA